MTDDTADESPWATPQDVGECPVCGDRHHVSYIVESGTKDLSKDMYRVDRTCYEDRGGVFVAYVHGEEL